MNMVFLLPLHGYIHGIRWFEPCRPPYHRHNTGFNVMLHNNFTSWFGIHTLILSGPKRITVVHQKEYGRISRSDAYRVLSVK